MHLAAAQMTGIDELAITDEEGGLVMDAAQKVARHYNVQTTQKTLDWVAFAGAMATVYGQRLYVILNKPAAKLTPQAPRTDNVVRPAAFATAPAAQSPSRGAAPVQSVPTMNLDIAPDPHGAGDVATE